MIKKRTSVRMARLARQWRQSGESQASFARHHPMPNWTLWYWWRKLAAVVWMRLTLDPLSGHLFLFRNRRGDRLKVVAWDRSGFWILYKRLEQGPFAWPATDAAGSVEMRSTGLPLLLGGIDIAQTRR